MLILAEILFQMIVRMIRSCGKLQTAMVLHAVVYLTALPKEPRYVINLKLPHKQMHYRQGSFFKELKGKTVTKVVKNTLPGHEKPKIYTTKASLGGVSLVGLSL